MVSAAILARTYILRRTQRAGESLLYRVRKKGRG
jgi:hypothetical protein